MEEKKPSSILEWDTDENAPGQEMGREGREWEEMDLCFVSSLDDLLWVFSIQVDMEAVFKEVVWANDAFGFLCSKVKTHLTPSHEKRPVLSGSKCK